MAYLFFALGVAVLALGGGFAYLRRHDTTACITCILLGIFLSTILMVFPTHWLEAEKDLESRGMYAFLLSVFYALDTIGGGQNIGQIESMPLAARKSAWIKPKSRKPFRLLLFLPLRRQYPSSSVSLP